MGALHEGHLSLIRQAAAENENVFVSIFVNPTQFGVNEDLDSYPRTWDADIKQLKSINQELASSPGSGRVSVVFAPTTKVMYPTIPPSSELNGDGSFVTISPLGKVLEGSSRPVFFRGVTTVCMKLFNIVQPDNVYFGQKDIQQTVVVRRMVEDFHLNTKVNIGTTQRELDGLAMSSRNVYLGTRRRKVGTVLFLALSLAEQQYKMGKFKRDEILWPANEIMTSLRLRQEELPAPKRALYEVDYISLAHPDTLEELEEIDPARGGILSGAIKMQSLEEPQGEEDCGLGKGAQSVRLIDNVILKPMV
ncbi:MAG: hypothetical protein Q9165_005742 [Trypethelium subeluteriae]